MFALAVTIAGFARADEPVVAWTADAPVTVGDLVRWMEAARHPGYRPATREEAERLLRVYLRDRAGVRIDADSLASVVAPVDASDGPPRPPGFTGASQ